MRVSLAVLVMVALTSASTAEAFHRTDTARHSDVCFLTEKYWEPPFDPAPYQAYGATVQAWGGWPWSADAVFFFGLWIHEHHQEGILYDATVNMVTAMPYGLAIHPELQDATCLDIEGNKIVVPYISDTWLGVPAYWGCINNPVFQSHLVDRVGWATDAGADGIHLDDTPANGLPIMLWQEAGCFCDYCNEGFRQWLDEQYSTAELAALGIGDIATYDYRVMVQALAPTVASFTSAYTSGQIPLSGDFHKFQLESAAEMVQTLNQTADAAHPGGLPVSGNVPYLYPYTLKAISHLDSLVTENHFDPASNSIPGTLTKNYKLAEALDLTMISVPGPSSFAGVDGKWGLYRLWIAHAYALGQNLVSPDFVAWLPTLEPPSGELAPYYQFVRANAHLLNDYGSVEQVGVLYSNVAARQAILDQFGFYVSVDENIASPVCEELLQANIAFGVAAAGDAFLARTLTESELSSRFELLVVPEANLAIDPNSSGVQQVLVEQWLADGRAIVWNGDVQDILDKITPLFVQEPPREVWVLPRKNGVTSGAPLVVHVVNHSYNAATDSLDPQLNVNVMLTSELVGRHKVQSVTAHSPENPSQTLPLTFTPEGVSVAIPSVDSWVILEVGTVQAVPALQQQKCINALNKGLWQVEKKQARLVGDCLKAFAKGKLVEPSIETCTTIDTKGKVGKATGKVTRDEAKKCVSPLPDYGSTDATTVIATGTGRPLELAHAIFGPNLDIAAFAESGGDTAKKASRCQQSAWKATAGCLDTRLKEFNRCKRTGLKAVPGFTGTGDIEGCMDQSTNSKVLKKCDAGSTSSKLRSAIAKRCSDVEPNSAFPGLSTVPDCDPSTDAGLAACLETSAGCYACLSLNDADGLLLDCDQVDDGAANSSCP